MREVPAKLFGFMREMSRRGGADVEAAQAGLAAASVDVDAPGERVDWDDVAAFLERAHGGQSREELERLGETYVEVQLWQQLVARVVGTPRLLYEVCFGLLTPPSFPHLQVAVESHRRGVRIDVRLPEPYRESLVFFHCTTGEIRMMPTLLGRAPVEVEADVTPRRGIYEVRLEEPGARDRALGAARRASDRLTDEVVRLFRRMVSADVADDAATASTVLDLQRRHGLTHTEARVAARLAAGLSVKEIAAALGVRVSTVRTHLQSAYAKTGTHGQTELVRLVLTGTARA